MPGSPRYGRSRTRPSAPPFDPELAVQLAAFGDPTANAPDGPAEVPAWRAGLTAADPTTDELRGDAEFEIFESTVPGPRAAPDVALLFARPVNLATGAPIIYHAHGGGMIGGTNRTGVAGLLREWAAPLGLVLVSVNYRLAPENPHPAPIEDCYAGLDWVARNGEEFGGDPSRIVVAGGSAGGGLAAALALLARDRGGPALVGQLAMCPMLDDRNDTVSAAQMTGRGVWDRRANEVGWSCLLGDARATAEVSPYAAPARARDLSGLPPAYLDAGTAETYRDETVSYASRIWEAGGDAELHLWSGGFHGFDQMAPDAAVSRQARRARVDWLRRVLSR